MFIPLPDDFHAHLRQGSDLKGYVEDLAKVFGRALIMPNTIPAMTQASQILEYKNQILDIAQKVRSDFLPLMTFKLNPNYTENDLIELKKVGVVAGKYYPMGVTTNSSDGISEFEKIFPVVSLMEKLDLVLCIHGEEPNVFCLDREETFIERVKLLAQNFPKLRIVFEHLSSRKSVKAVEELPQNVAATITVHHLTMTLDDVIGDALRPHHFCKPLPKRPEDRAELRRVAFSGNPKFFLGTDSAPHKLNKKECPCGAAGVYSAPVAIPLLLREFEKENHLDKISDFVAGFGADFYKIPRTNQKIEVIQEKWTVPTSVNGVTPLAAGETLEWKIKI